MNLLLKSALGLSLLAAATIHAHEINVEALAQALGRKTTFERSEVWMLPLSKIQVEAVNAGRKLTGKVRQSFEEANQKPFVNREYTDDALTILENELREATGKQPTRQVMFYAWARGLKAMGKVGFDPAKVKDANLETKWRLFEAVTERLKQAGIAPALPTDGRQPMPTRFGHVQGRGEGR